MDKKKWSFFGSRIGCCSKTPKHEGSSSTQACLDFSRGANSLFFIPLHIKLLAFSTCPFVFGCATDANFSLIPKLSQ
jgi:hypothetical protein